MSTVRKRGISEKTVIVLNPLPAVDEAILLKEAKLEHVEPRTTQPFGIHWKYSFGEEAESVYLGPGDAMHFRESDAADILRELSEQGVTSYEVDADDASVFAATRKGLEAAVKFYRDRGAARITAYRKTHGLSKEELEEQRYDIDDWHLNQAKSDFIQGALKKLRPPTSNATK